MPRRDDSRPIHTAYDRDIERLERRDRDRIQGRILSLAIVAVAYALWQLVQWLGWI